MILCESAYCDKLLRWSDGYGVFFHKWDACQDADIQIGHIEATERKGQVIVCKCDMRLPNDIEPT